jgi:hypothetical protein
MAEARRLKVSFANFVRQAVADKLPEYRKDATKLRRRRADPLFRLLNAIPLLKDVPRDVSENHDDYLYGKKSEFRKR